MARAIKRAGVIFLALAIICLLAIGVLIGVSSAKNDANNSLDLSNKIEQASATSEEEISPIVEEVLLDGATCEEQAAKWTEAIEKSLANGGNQHILVTMMNDWIAPNSGNHNFGESIGFSDGRICVPENATITLDLNSYKIDRGLTSAVDNGSVMLINGGTFILKDSCYDSAKIQNAYKASDKGEVDLSNYTTGRITGGFNANAQYSQSGGGISILNGYFIMNGGMIYNNKSNQGGGIHIASSTAIINDGLINNNLVEYDSNELGGGVYSYASTIYVKGGIIHKNIASGKSGDAGGLAVTASTGYISGGIFANNECLSTGGALGGAVFISSSDYCTITGGVYENNKADYGGAISNWNSTCSISNVYIANNYSHRYGSIDIEANAKSVYMENIIVVNNSSDLFAGGICARANITLGEGVQVYDNLCAGERNNLYVAQDIQITISDNLLKAGSHIGVNMQAGTGVFTTGYSSSGNAPSAPATFFFADEANKSVSRSGDEVQIDANSAVLKEITWKVNGVGESGNAYAVLPYTGKPYNLTASVDSIPLTISTVYGSTLTPVEPGNYSYYVGEPFINPTFKIIIEEPKKEIEKPINKTYKMLYEDGETITFYPEGFDSNTMEIAYYMKKSIGKYSAKVSLKDAWNTTWEDESTDALYYEFEIIPYGIEGKENSGYELICMENGYRKSYSESEYVHLINDKEIATINGETRYVLGNIPAKTSVKTFIENLRNESNKIKIYNNNKLIYDGITSNGVVDDSLNNILVATGFKIEYYWDNKLYDEVYLSVLGDVIADGVINTLDVTFVNRIAKGEVKLDTLSIEQQLAAMVDNKGKVTSIDGKILLNVIGGNTETNSYFENVTQKDKYQLWDLAIDTANNKVYRTNTDITTQNLIDNAIIGNIAPNTKAIDFKAQLASQLGIESSALVVYKANGAIATDNNYVGTGSHITYNGKTIYLSVLGDLTGDGRVDTTDMTYLNRIVNGNVNLNTNVMEQKLIMLAATIQNKGDITTADSESIWNYIGGNVDMTKYF